MEGRAIRSRIASCGDLPCCRMACICSVIGISTPIFAARPTAAVGRQHAFGDHAVHAGDDVVQVAAASEFDADGAIAREAAGAGEHEIAQSGQSRHGFRATAAGDDQARDLRQSAGDERGHRVVSQAEPVTNAGGNGDDVLERAAQLHSYDVIIGVNPKARIAELALHDGREFLVGRGDCQRGGMVYRNFFGESGSAKRSDAGSESVGSDCCSTSVMTSVMRRNVSFSMPLVALTNSMSACRCGSIALKDAAGVVRRHHADHDIGVAQRIFEAVGRG